MPNTYTLLETITVGAAGAASVTFNSIPQTGYTDLIIKGSARSLSGSSFSNMTISFNGSAANYTLKWLGYANGSPTSADRSGFGANQLAYAAGAGATANTFANFEIYIPNYRSSNFKSISVDGVNENNSSTTYFGLSAGLWSQTAAITSLTLSDGSTISQHSTFTLYGVSALGVTPTKAPKATGGSIIQTDGTYWYHAFLSSGTFTPATALSCDVLVVAGGGGGGNNAAGGGGAGGVFYAASQSVGTSGQTVTIGAGGAAGAVNSAGTSGSNSSFAALTAAVGGGGGGARTGSYSQPALTGGSGGGAPGDGNRAGAAGTSGQGFAGGDSLDNGSYFNAGGGGGSGAVGSNATSSKGGNGGAGTNTYSSWLSTTGLGVSGFIAGGGGGGSAWNSGSDTGPATAGSGGAGAGGSRSAAVNATAATANTGSGGGGGSNSSWPSGGAGGSGVVIVRYLA
jgi:hypothetical protein